MILLLACTSPDPGDPAKDADTAVDTDTPVDTDTGTADTSTAAVPENPGFVRLADPLDEPESYCLDVPGHAEDIHLDGVLQAHTCKEAIDDQLFRGDHPEAGQLHLEDHGLCVAATELAAGASLVVEACEAGDRQRWASADGVVAPAADPSLCWAVADGEGEVAAGESHLRRDVRLETCDGVDDGRKRWVIPGGGLGAR
jgi:hypothetical protein